MPVVACPSCAVSLNLGDDLYGRSVKCPKCEHVFVVSAPETIPLPAPSVGPTPPRSLAGDPLGLDEDEERRRRDDDVDVPRRRRRRREFDEDDDDADVRYQWGTGRAGVRVALIGAGMFFPIFVGMSIAMAVLFVMTRPGAAGDFGPRMDGPPGFVVLLMCGFTVLLIISAIVHFVGQVMCCWSPPPYHSKAVRCMICFGLSIAATVVMFCVMLVMDGPGRGRLGNDRQVFGYAFLLVVGSLAVVTQSYWFSYLAGVADRFGDGKLVGRCGALLIANVLFFAVFFAGTFLMGSVRSLEGYQRYSVNVFVWGNTALVGWYLLVVVRVNALLRHAVDDA